jgi:hypothetical protein
MFIYLFIYLYLYLIIINLMQISENYQVSLMNVQY